MNKPLYIILFLSSLYNLSFSQTEKNDSLKNVNLEEVVVTSNRVPVMLKDNPGAISLVRSVQLAEMPKGIGAEEALRLVPGVRIDNQHDGERVHISIRGQGILTERGLRGIGVLLDGIPLNDPSGFAPDLYDVDWSTVRKIEVLRGPVAGLYGGGGAAGLINITTQNGGPKPLQGELGQTVGSNGFSKSLVQIDGTEDPLDYRVSYSRSKGNGYRDHQAFRANNLYEKVNFHPSEKLTITQIIAHTDYFQQNPEGLSLEQLSNPRQANPDAVPFNEYQKTNRTTIGFHGMYKISQKQDVQATSYLRSWRYKETSNKAAEYRDITNPGMNAQYNLHLGNDLVKHTFSLGSDLEWQTIGMYKLQSAADPNRVESIDETNIESSNLLANQIISQRSAGVYGLYNLEIGKFSLIGNLRYDANYNELTDKMSGPDTAKTNKDFSNVSGRVGVSYQLTGNLTAYANWSQGFMPPSTEELANNPVGYSGFNTHLVPSTSNCYEIGARGFFGNLLNFELTGFYMKTENDFFRFKQSGRGNQEVFYGNAGNSRRFGIESFVSVNILQNLRLQAVYTYANYEYTSATVDPVYTDASYVLTTPPDVGQWLPNSPRHQLYAELVYSVTKNLSVTLSTEYQSKWAIYTDAKAYHNELDQAVYQNWQDGFNLYHARVSYKWSLWKLNGDASVFFRNLANTEYMAFTEPDPDGNSYQPGPGREIFGSITVKF